MMGGMGQFRGFLEVFTKWPQCHGAPLLAPAVSRPVSTPLSPFCACVQQFAARFAACRGWSVFAGRELAAAFRTYTLGSKDRSSAGNGGNRMKEASRRFLPIGHLY